jgi:hypothetical protein
MADDARNLADSGPQTVLHTAAELELGGNRLRQECWDEMPARVRDRLNELAGPVVYWWATPDGRHADMAAKAFVFGERGLYLAEPRGDGGTPPVHWISGFDIVSGSVTVDDVEHNPAPAYGDAEAGGGTRSSAATEPEASDVPDIGLSPDAKGVLGNLPPRAQQLLQAPFATGLQVRRQEYFYQGYPHDLEIFVFFLAGDDDLVIATGKKLIPDGHDDATAHWSLQVHRALVTARPEIAVL